MTTVLTLDDVYTTMSAIIYAISIYTTHTNKNNELIERKENNIESNREDSKLLPD